MFCWEKKWASWLLTCSSKQGWAAGNSSKEGVNKKHKYFLSSQTCGLGKIKERAPRSGHVHFQQDIGHIRENHLQATLLPQLSKYAQAEPTYIAHDMFGQIKMKIPWYNSQHTLISRKRGGKPRMISGQLVVVRVGVHQLSVSSNTSSYASNLQ